MDKLLALGLTLIVGIFILIGTLIVFFTKNNNKFIKFSISMAFGVMISLAIVELMPEAFELLESQSKTILKIVFFTTIGILSLAVLDKIVPHHDHGHEHEHGEMHNMMHIGLISSIALVLHNLIEGMALYLTTLEDLKIGILMVIGIGLHNIPLGIIITSAFYKGNNNKVKTFFISLGIALSTFVGGLIMLLLQNKMFNDYITGILICLTLGMILYIAIFELLPQMFCKKDKKINIVGIITGIIILLISRLF